MSKIKFIFKSFIDVIILVYYKLYFKCKKTKMTNIWLISERGIDARDNGYWFYKYMKENHPEIPVKYVITKSSSDYSKIAEEDVVLYRTKQHYYYFLYAQNLISAEIMGFSPNEQLYYRLVKYNIIKLNGKNIFLQHGITHNYNTYMDPKNTKLDLFICGAVPEQKFMIEKYGYTEKQAVLTGFARFDGLVNNQKKIILIMPTWRKWLKYLDTLEGTQYRNEFMRLINDKDIINALKKKNYKIVFYPHIMLQKFIGEFKSASNLVTIAGFENYDVQDLLKKSSLLVTDYSSVAFDFAYMNKKVIYYQFDNEKYRKEQYAAADGFYSYEKDGFGPVCFDFKSVKKNILDYIDNNKCFDNYNSRISNFFEKNDHENCKRIYKEIKRL